MAALNKSLSGTCNWVGLYVISGNSESMFDL